jgi:hypothetical protein
MKPIRMPRSTLRFLYFLMAAGGAAVSSSSLEAVDMKRPTGPVPLAPHRDGNIAVAEELAAARRAGTIKAYDLFLARHPTHALARTARRERGLLSNRHRRRE